MWPILQGAHPQLASRSLSNENRKTMPSLPPWWPVSLGSRRTPTDNNMEAFSLRLHQTIHQVLFKFYSKLQLLLQHPSSGVSIHSKSCCRLNKMAFNSYSKAFVGFLSMVMTGEWMSFQLLPLFIGEAQQLPARSIHPFAYVQHLKDSCRQLLTRGAECITQDWAYGTGAFNHLTPNRNSWVGPVPLCHVPRWS